MALTKAKGNMYSWVTHTWSPIKGCGYACPYCYVRSMEKRYGTDFHTVRLDQKMLKDNLGKNRTIFVGHLTDMWGPWVDSEWIYKVLNHCSKYPHNTYAFQTKNPGRFMDVFPQSNFLYGTTIETDEYPPNFKTQAPSPWARYVCMQGLASTRRRFVTIEPIMEFNLVPLVKMIKNIKPEFVTIGADSKGHHLAEPSWDKVQQLIFALQEITEIRQKTNLERLNRWVSIK